jgi:membrane protein YdbS with pleckstrin-like domain
MQCPKCNAEVNPNSLFCPKCGDRLDSPEKGLFPSSTQTPSVAEAQGGAAHDTPADARSRIEEMVQSDKETLWQGRYSFKGIVPWMIFAGLVLVLLAFAGWWLGSHEWKWWGEWGGRWFWRISWAGVLAVWVYQLLLFAWRNLAHGYRLTPQTFFHEKGFVFHSTSPIEIVGIDDMTLDQAMLERFFGVGTIRLLSKDMSDPVIVMKGIPNVKDAFAKIDQARRAERRARAVRVENV